MECIQECISKRGVSLVIPTKQSSCEEAVFGGMRCWGMGLKHQHRNRVRYLIV